ncbi:MAG TPA: M13 family metallopeptidase [Mucilaginibacter sp.]|jgi:putative endopeptidase|nr:M13 family metallopeptidase [Mucilaginibacter sp.]
MKINFKNIALAGTVCLITSAFVIDGPKPKRKYIDPANMDQSVKPGDDFYQYANGHWLKTNKIPAKQSDWGGFSMLQEDNTHKLENLLAAISDTKGQPKGSLKQRVGDLYISGMDSLAIEKRGYEPIKEDLARVDKIADVKGVITEVAYARTNGRGGTLFGFGIGQDSKNVSKYIVNFAQGGLTLPDRDYYLKDSERNKKIREAYRKYIVTLFTLTGTDAAVAAKNADIIISIETSLAKPQLSRVELRDPNKTYNKFSISDFSKTTPHLDWAQIMPMLKVTSKDSVIVEEPEFFKAEDGLLTSIPVSDWKVYLRWNILKNSAGSLSSAFVNARFDFNSVLSGQKVQAPRNERMTYMVDGGVGELLGQLYVEKYFTPAAKQRMLNLVNNLKLALGERIKNLAWMSPETKTRALKKLSAFTVKIGYPDKWEKYANLDVERGDYIGNLRRISKWKYNYMVTRLGKPVDKTLWGMTPPTVNAYYNPVNNEIVFPAGILQSPFFDPTADDAVNYGAIGAVIGHEMTHGFDDEGRQYDADGTLRDWWTKGDADKFKGRADMVANQFNAFTVLDTVHVNGRLTLGENLADLGGLNVAYDAFKKTAQGKSNVKIDGFTPDQRFFLSFAQIWRSLQRPEYTAQLVTLDPHSPDRYRVDGPVSNVDVWYKAFNIKPGDKMYKKPEDRIRVW